MKINTICRLCSGCCPVEAEVLNGKILSVERAKRYSDAIHQVCPKLQAAPEIIYSPRRITHPLLKNKKAEWETISWDSALEVVCNKMNIIKDEYGAEAVCWLRGQAPDWGGNWHYAMRLMHAFGSPNVIGNGSVCHAGREALQAFTYGEMTSPDYKNSKCILCWGRNDKDTNPTAYEDLLYARAKGAKLVVIDPVKTSLAEMADIWLQIKPGTDGFLAMSFIYYLIKHDLTDNYFIDKYTVGFDLLKKNIDRYSPEAIAPIVQLPAEKIIEAVQLYINNTPACIAEGNGLDMHCYVSQVTRAIAILRAISGNLDKKGGDLIPQPVKIKDYQLRSFYQQPLPVSQDYPLFSQYSARRGIHVLGTLVDTIIKEKPYPVKGLLVQGANPIITMANAKRVIQALQKLEFVVVIDPMMTQTAKLADLILPASFSFEQTMLSNQAVSNNCVRLQKKVIEPVGESKPDWEIIFLIAKKLGLNKEFPWEKVEEAIDDQLYPAGMQTKNLINKPGGISLENTRYQKYAADGFKTPSGKVEIKSSLLAKYNYRDVPDFWEDFQLQNPSFYKQKETYPLVGLSGQRPNYFVHSQFRHIDSLRKKEEEPLVDINPKNAQEIGIKKNDLINISTPNGQIKMKANITDIVAPGEIRIAWGWGEYSEKYNLNLLTDDSTKDLVTSTTSNRLFMCKIQKVK